MSYTDVRFINVAAEVIFLLQHEEDGVGCGQECYLYKMS